MEIPRHWRLKAQRYRLEGSTCPTCGLLIFPPRPACLPCTAQPVKIAAGLRQIFLALSGLSDIELHQQQMMERMIR